MIQRYFEINEDGHNVRCKLYCQDSRNIGRVVITCHGFGGHKDNTAAGKFAERLLSKYKNVGLITFNLPCHGDDVKKKLYLADCGAYLRLVIRHAREKLNADSLYAYATSFGGYLILKYILEAENPFRKIALRCPAVNMHEAITSSIIQPQELELLQKGRDIPVGFDRKIPVSAGFLQELKDMDIQTWDFLDHAEDILILHGTADEIIPFDAVRQFTDNNLIEFLPIEGADHRFQNPRHMDQAMKAITEWFAL